MTILQPSHILILIPGKGVGAVSKRAFSPLPIGAGDGCTTYFVTFFPATRGYPGGAVSQRHPINDVPRATGGARTNQRVALRRRVATAGLLVLYKQKF